MYHLLPCRWWSVPQEEPSNSLVESSHETADDGAASCGVAAGRRTVGRDLRRSAHDAESDHAPVRPEIDDRVVAEVAAKGLLPREAGGLN